MKFILANDCKDSDAQLVEFNGEHDHVHLVKWGVVSYSANAKLLEIHKLVTTSFSYYCSILYLMLAFSRNSNKRCQCSDILTGSKRWCA